MQPVSQSRWGAYHKRIASLPGASVLLLRAFLGFTYTFAGLQKLTNSGFFEQNAVGSMQQQLAASHTPFHFLVVLAQQAPVLFGIVIAAGELAVGLGTIFGIFPRLAAAGGMALSLVFFLTVSWNAAPYYYGPDIVFFFAWTPILIGGGGPFTIDAFVAERVRACAVEEARTLPAARRREALQGETIERRVLVAKGGSAALLGIGALVLGAVAAVVGRVVTPASRVPTSGTVPSLGGGGNTGSGSSTTTTTASGAPHRGPALGPASAVPVGGAATFTDAAAGGPCYLLQPKAGHFVAFSRICTHEACTVNFVQSAEQFQCPCHGSVYDAATGQVLSGPAPLPLPSVPVVEVGGTIYLQA